MSVTSEQTPREVLVKVIRDQQALIAELQEALIKKEIALSSLRRYNAHTDKWGPDSAG